MVSEQRQPDIVRTAQSGQDQNGLCSPTDFVVYSVLRGGRCCEWGRPTLAYARMTRTTAEIILIIDDDDDLRDVVIRLLARSFPTYCLLGAHDAIEGIALVRQYAPQLRLIILDIQMPRLDGRVAATVIRDLVPGVPVMPFSRYADRFPLLLELGCVAPVCKAPHTIHQLPQQVAQALRAQVPPLPSAAWIRMAQAQARLTLDDGETSADREMVHFSRTNLNRVRSLLDQYVRRFTSPAREVLQARRVLEEHMTD